MRLRLSERSLQKGKSAVAFSLSIINLLVENFTRMKPIAEHRAKLKEIADYAFYYGFGAMKWEGDPQPPTEWSTETSRHFYEKCNEGYKKAQALLIEERTAYQQQLRDATSRQKIARVLHLKNDAAAIGTEIATLEVRLSALAHIADGIAWTLLGGQLHLVRRLHMQETESKFLDTSNIAHAVQEAEKINVNPLNFALLADLTGTVQIGDLLVRHPHSIEIIELKEGGVNDKIIELFDATEQMGKSLTEVDLSALDAKTVAQARRMMRQREKKANAEGVMTNDIGTEPVTKRPIAVSTPLIATENYYGELLALREKLLSGTSAYTCIEGCLHIGMYRGESIPTVAPVAIKFVVEQATENYILIDWASIIDHVSEPIFAKPFDREFVLDFLTGQIKVIMALDIDALMRTFNAFGLQSDWMTTKETTKLKEMGLGKQIVMFKHKGIKLTLPTDGDMMGVLGGGIVSKILYDNILPSNIALSMLNSDRPKLSDIDDKA